MVKESVWFQRLLASEKWILLGKMASGIAHELNNPIMIIQNYVSLLVDDIADKSSLTLTPDSEYAENFRDLLKQCERMSNITKNLLEFSRTRSQRPKLYDLKDIIISILNLIEPMLVRNQIQVHLDLSSNPIKSAIIFDEFQQVIMNLIDNSIYALNLKYPENPQKPHHKYLHIALKEVKANAYQSTQNDGKDEGLHSVTSMESYAQIEITDDGIGIHPQDFPYIFEPFYTTKKSKVNLPENKQHQGLGLGLTYSKHIIENYNGRIEFESKMGEFTRFIITLPTKPSQDPDQEIVF